uniref:Uncharacterized protein n=1 Tax=Onchocerca volvulus TaxID=6282 RepID=A0A8R1U309_ONCVO
MEYFLPPEQVSPTEAIIRQRINFCLRLLIAFFFSYQLFDFMSLNQKNDFEFHTKSAGEILQHQLSICGYSERIIYSTILVFIIWIFLFISGFRNRNRTVWQLLYLSILIGVLTANLRFLQMKQRLYSAIHEGFYAYLLIFFIGLILTLQINERINISNDEVKVNNNEPSITHSNSTLATTKKLS